MYTSTKPKPSLLILFSLKLSPAYFVTCEYIIGVKFHVHLVLLCYVSHDPLGATVLLSGQQPTQWLREDPNKEGRRGMLALVKAK